MPLDRALDLDDPVRHLLADEGGGACLQVVFEAHVPLGGRAENEAVSRLTSPRIIRHANAGCQRIRSRPRFATPLPPPRAVGLSSQGHAHEASRTRRAGSSSASTGACGRASATPAGGPASRRSRSASGRSWSRTPRGRTSSARSTRLRARRLLSFEALDRLSASRLAPLLRSSGTFRVKARRLRAFLDFLGAEYGGRVEAMRAEEPGAPAPEAPGGAGHRSGDRRLDRPLRRRATRSSSWTPTPGASSRASGLLPRRLARRYDEVAALPDGPPAARRRALQRLPRPARAPGEGPLPPAAPLRRLPPRRPLPEARACRHPEELRSSRATKDPQSRCPVLWKAMLKALPSFLLLLSLAAALRRPGLLGPLGRREGRAQRLRPEAAALRRREDGDLGPHLRDGGLLRRRCA